MASNRDIELPNNLSSFVCDSMSKQVIDAAVTEIGLGYTTSVEGDVGQAVEFLRTNRPPKILLIDLSNSDLPMTDMEKIIEMCSPEVNIITIGAKNDVGLFRTLLKLGVSDYLVKPLSVDLIKKAISTIVSGTNAYDTPESRKGKIISFVGMTGGIGTTTLATNCAWILANKFFKRSVIIDSDHQFGNANLLLDIKTESSYIDMLESPDKIDDYFVETSLKRYGPRLFYLGGKTDISRNAENDVEAFSHFLEMVRKQFNYLTVDLKLNINQLNKVLISRTQSFVIIADLSTASAYNTATFIEYLKQDSREKNLIVVLNKIGMFPRGGISKDAFEKIVGMQVNYIMPFDTQVPYGAANVGQPIATLDCKLNDIMHNIVQGILGVGINKNKMHEVYNDSIFSEYGMKKILDKVGLGKFIFSDEDK